MGNPKLFHGVTVVGTVLTLSTRILAAKATQGLIHSLSLQLKMVLTTVFLHLLLSMAAIQDKSLEQSRPGGLVSRFAHTSPRSAYKL